MLSYYLNKVLGINSVVIPSTMGQLKPQLWIVSEGTLEAKESDLLEKMLKAVKMNVGDFKIVGKEEAAESPIQAQDSVLWFSDEDWSYQDAQVMKLCNFKHFFELEGDALKDLKKSVWEKLKAFAYN